MRAADRKLLSSLLLLLSLRVGTGMAAGVNPAPQPRPDAELAPVRTVAPTCDPGSVTYEVGLERARVPQRQDAGPPCSGTPSTRLA